MTEAEQVMKRCQIGTRNYDEANNLHADCYRVIGKLLAEHAMREVQRLGQEIDQEPIGFVQQSVLDWLYSKHRSSNAHTITTIAKSPTETEDVAIYTAPPQRTEQEPEEHRLLRRKWFGHRDTGHLSFTEAVDVTMEKIYSQPKPVAWMDADGNVSDNNDHKCFPIPLYTTPPQRKPLTDEQRKDLMNKAWDKWLGGKDDNHLFAWHFSFEVEAAHGIKENT